MHWLWAVQAAPKARVPVELTAQRPVVVEQSWPEAQLIGVQPGTHNPAWQMVAGGEHWASLTQLGVKATQRPALQARPLPQGGLVVHGSQRQLVGLHT